MFTTGALERYADEMAPLLPIDDARFYPVSGGSEAVETALKMARAYHLARGEPSRFAVIARRSAYHGNTLGALDASGKEPLRKPYTPWLGRFLHAPAAYEYRCENPTHPDACGAWHAGELERMISQAPDEIGGGVHRRAGGRRDARRRGAVRRLLAGGRGGLPSPRRAGDRRRGDDRPRSHRTLVRVRPLGCAARHPDRRQGHDERLRAVRVRGGERRGLRGPVDARGSSTASRGRTTGSAPLPPVRSCACCASDDLVARAATIGGAAAQRSRLGARRRRRSSATCAGSA